MEKKLSSYDPSNGNLVGEVQITPIEQVSELVSNAQIAAKSWKTININDRVKLLEKAYSNIEPQVNKLAVLLSQEMGKDIRRSTGEVHGTVFGGSYLAQATREALTTKNLPGGTKVEFKPLGVAAVISPWNYPLAMANNLIVPSLVAGNTVIFKPSEETPLIAKAFTEHLNEVLPKHVLQIMYGDGEQGKALVESDINIVAFTGSQATGRDIMARASNKLKRLVMELGGNDPMIVMKDSLWAPLASVFAFGIVFSMILTLLVIPVLYSLLIKPKKSIDQ